MKLVKGFDELALTLLCTDNNTKERPHFVLAFKGKLREGNSRYYRKVYYPPCREWSPTFQN
jgi:hypothetical protein